MKRRLLLAACLLSMINAITCGTPATPIPANASQEQLVRLPPEVRLRKLHLVRPDLIQYPICFEVYC